jgi:hypothetical protein
MYVKGAIAGIILLVLGMYFWVFWAHCVFINVFIQAVYFYAGFNGANGFRIIKSKFMKHFY